MSCYRIFYREREKLCAEVTSKEQFVALRNQSHHLATLTRARFGNIEEKRRLTQFNYSCIPGENMRLKGCATASTSVGMDVDFEEPDVDIGEAIRRVMAKKDEVGLLMLERSVSKGFHAVFRRRDDMSQEENLKWAAEVLGVKYDEHAKDITRVFFATSGSPDDLIYVSDELFINKKSERQEESYMMMPINMPVEKEKRVETEGKSATAPTTFPATYNGIEYSKIVEQLESIMGGKPEHGSRNNYIFSMACLLRHICNDDARWIMTILPTYGEDEPKWRRTIESACNRQQEMNMPKKVKTAIKLASSTTESESEDDYKPSYEKHPIMAKFLPMGVRDSLNSVSERLYMAVIGMVAPIIGTLATGVKIMVHGDSKGINLMSFIVGKAASGKGSLDDIYGIWTSPMQEMDDEYYRRENEYRKSKRRLKNAKEQPEEPHFPVRCVSLNCTVANLSERLENAGGKHCISFAPEADTLHKRWKTNMGDTSVMLRQAYDGSRYDCEARSYDAVSVHIPHLLWNVVMCGTPDALYRLIPNTSDGLMTRFGLFSVPDNTYEPLTDNGKSLTEEKKRNIRMIAEVLMCMEGELTLKSLESTGKKWLNDVLDFAIRNDDPTMADMRKRTCVTTQRIIAAIILCDVAEKLIREYGFEEAKIRIKNNPPMLKEWAARLQTKKRLDLFHVIADYLLDNCLMYFRKQIEKEQYDLKSMSGNRSKKGKNDTIFDRLPDEFTLEDARVAKGESATLNSAKMMTRNWKNQGLVIIIDGGFRKVA